MQRRSLGVFLSLVVLSATAQATTPPVYRSFEEQICRASHVFIGTAQNLRVIPNDRESCGDTPPEAQGTLTMCGLVEVDIQIDTVLYPAGWKPAGRVVYRFGGGYFNVASLRKDLEGTRRLFHVVEKSGLDPLIFESSQAWVLSAFPEDQERVTAALEACKRTQ